MKVTCNSLLEAPLINLIKLYDSLNVKGICGILTPNSKHNVEHTTISSLAMLSYCNELEVVDSFNEQLRLIDIKINKGPITYHSVADVSGGLLKVPNHLTSEPFAMATNEVNFQLLLGTSTSVQPLRGEDVYSFIAKNKPSDYHFTDIPMPLLSKRILKFKTNSGNGFSTIECDNVNPGILEELISSLKVE